MKRSLLILVSMLFAISMFTASGFAQSNPPPIPPCNGCKMGAVEGSNPDSPVLAGTLVINNFNTAADSRADYIRNAVQSLLQTDRISVIYQTDLDPSVVRKLADEGTAVSQVRYSKVDLQGVAGDFFDTLKDFLVTDGQRYFRIVLGKPELKAFSN